MVFNKPRNNLVANAKCLKFIFLVCFILLTNQFILRSPLLACFGYNRNMSSSHMNSLNRSEVSNNTVSPPRTLIVYIYGKTHPFSEQNLAFFIRTAVRDSHDADYYFILQQIDNIYFDERKLPLLPSNARYIQHENKCFDLGTVGWFLSSGMIDKTKYKYFIFLNSSVRGPFTASYYDSTVWYTIYTRRLTDQIKLVGSTISCQIAPHVQSYIWALDVTGLNFLLKNSKVFACHKSLWDTVVTAEVDASRILLKAGFGIDSLMKKYQGVDFRSDSNKKCIVEINPTFNRAADGITLDPFEVVFVKMKNKPEQDLDNRERVRVYEKWIHG